MENRTDLTLTDLTDDEANVITEALTMLADQARGDGLIDYAYLARAVEDRVRKAMVTRTVEVSDPGV